MVKILTINPITEHKIAPINPTIVHVLLISVTLLVVLIMSIVQLKLWPTIWDIFIQNFSKHQR